MTQPQRRLPRFNRAELEAIRNRLSRLSISADARNLILQSLNAAANPQGETVDFGIASLPPERQNQVFEAIDDVAPAFEESESEFDERIESELDNAVANADDEGVDILLVLALLALYYMSTAQYDSLYETLLDTYINSYRDGINAQLTAFGCGSGANSPEGRELVQLQTWAREDADSIRDTYNRESENELRRLHASNPLGTSAFYRASMAVWRGNRQSYKAQQIALNTAQKGYGYGLQRFHERNTLQTRYQLVGVPPVCPICIDLFGRGLVDYSVVENNPMPIHINCPHTWEAVDTRTLDCGRAWRG